MAVTLQSTRFGTLEIPAEAVLEFPAGLIGLGGRRYALVSRAQQPAFVWLHSLDEPSLAIPLTDPWQFFADYLVELGDAEAARIGVEDPSQATVYVTVRAGGSLEDFSVNLRAPILIAHGRGFQVINEAPGFPVRAPLFPGHAEEQAA